MSEKNKEREDTARHALGGDGGLPQPIEGTVRDLSRSGEGVIKTERGAVFAAGVLPGERVSIMGLRTQSGALRSSKVRVVDASTQRVEPECSIVKQCGGCPLMIASPGQQTKFRRGLLQLAIDKLPGAEDISIGWVGAEAMLAYRHRARLSWTHTKRGLRFGYFMPRSDQIAEVRTCPVLDPLLDRSYQKLRRTVDELLSGSGSLHLAFGADDRAVAALESPEPQAPELYTALSELVQGGSFAGTALKAAGATEWATWGDPREVRRGHDNQKLMVPVAGFSQAHDAVNRKLVARVIELARPYQRHVLELFSGSGNLTVALAKDAQSLIAVESHEESAQACRENLRARGIEATVRTEDAETYRPSAVPDVVVLDPPRSGAPGAITRLWKLRAPEIVYVSCDPPTLGRDLMKLANNGYKITDAVALDMFPQTAHVESIVRMVRS